VSCKTRGARVFVCAFVCMMVFSHVNAADAKPAAPERTVKSKIQILPQPLRRGWRFDFLYEQGYALSGIGTLSSRFFARTRIGAFYMYEPWFFAGGLTLEGAGVPSLGIGLQFEVIHLWTGAWGQLGMTITTDADLVSSISAGWSIVGVEWQRRLTDGERFNNAWLIKLRVPIGIFLGAR
jgi:hypothetical protein